MAKKKICFASSLTGGADGSLDSIDGASLNDLDACIVSTSGYSYIYSLDADSALAESSPTVISPDSNAGDKRWVQVDVYSTAIEFLLGAANNFTSADTTPSVALGYLFNVPAAVTITNFDDPPATGTKLIEIIAGTDNVVIAHDASKIKLNGGIDVSLNTGDSMQFRYVDTVWVERLRNLL